MSGTEDASPTNSATSKTKSRRLQNACDICRQRKIRCDSGNMPNNICSNCIAFGSICTHTPSRRGKKRPTSSSANSSTRDDSPASFEQENQEAVRVMVSEVLSSGNSFKIPQDIATIRRIFVDFSKYIHRMENSQPMEPWSPARSDGFGGSDGFCSGRFFGKSSNNTLLNSALDLKKQHSDGSGNQEGHNMRPEFWMPDPRERLMESTRPLRFPGIDQMANLIEIFFSRCNKIYFFPLLHRPTFEGSISEGLHYRDYYFGVTVLCVCAIASRYTAEVRVSETQSPGWEWCSQVYPPRSSFISPPSIYEVQSYCLLANYLEGSSMPEASWTLVGIGLRCAQEVGSHRRQPSTVPPTVETELWKRVFWALLSSDIAMSSYYGRPRGLSTDDFDQDFPIECDDENWHNTELGLTFAQPQGNPSYISFWVVLLKLYDILDVVQRTIYGVKTTFASNPEVIGELDTLLHRWVDSIPRHLRWNPQTENVVFFHQSAMLYAHYYYIQILIHKPFISAHLLQADLSMNSVSICTNAARTCIHILETQASRDFHTRPSAQIILNCAIVLLFNVWRGRRLGLSSDLDVDMGHVYRCINLLRPHEPKYPLAGRICDFMEELISIGDLHLLGLTPADDAQGRFSFQPGFTLGVPTGRRGSGSEILPVHANELGEIPDWLRAAYQLGSGASSNLQNGPDPLWSIIESWHKECIPSHASPYESFLGEGIDQVMTPPEGQFSFGDWNYNGVM